MELEDKDKIKANASGKRQSKLKRRRRTNNSSNSFSQFAAGGGNACLSIPSDRGHKLSSKINNSNIGSADARSFGSGFDSNALAKDGDDGSTVICDNDDKKNSSCQKGVDNCSSSPIMIMEYPTVSNILNMKSDLSSDVQQCDSQVSLKITREKKNSTYLGNGRDRNSDSCDDVDVGFAMGRKRMSAEIDWFIENSMRSKHQIRNMRRWKKKKNDHGARMSCISGSIHHSILDTIVLNQDHDNNHDDADGLKHLDLEYTTTATRPQLYDGYEHMATSFQYVSPLAFPSLTKTASISTIDGLKLERKKLHHNELYHRGDGAIISCMDKNEEDGSSTLLAFPMVGSKTKSGRAGANNKMPISGSTMEVVQARGMIKIISKYGATIRKDCNIDEDQKAIGKLPFGAVRIFVDSKWLPPPSRSDSPELPMKRNTVSNMTSNSYISRIGVDDQNTSHDVDLEDTVLVGVMRYKVHLLSLDVSDEKANRLNDASMCSNIKVGNGLGSSSSDSGAIPPSSPLQFGWISDRSRLEDDPYIIGEIQK